jgi:hypothetical protein
MLIASMIATPTAIFIQTLPINTSLLFLINLLAPEFGI